MRLSRSDDIQPIVTDVLTRLSARIIDILPNVKIYHIGATAIPGALTKGDLDVVLRVKNRDFAMTVETLRTIFDVKQTENWDPYFASFGIDDAFAMPVGVQVVIKDSEADFFLFVRDHLRANPDDLAAYNRAKQESALLGGDAYWTAKNRVLAGIIAQRPKLRQSRL